MEGIASHSCFFHVGSVHWQDELVCKFDLSNLMFRIHVIHFEKWVPFNLKYLIELSNRSDFTRNILIPDRSKREMK